MTESAGDSEENIERDRGEANIIVDATAKPSDTQTARVVNRLDEAFQIATEGSRIFVERGSYRVTSNATSKIKSAFLFGNKNVSVIGASSKDCVLLYGQADDEESVAASLTQQVCSVNTHFLI